MSAYKKKRRQPTLAEFMQIVRGFCPGASDEWIKGKFHQMSPLECYDLWRQQSTPKAP